MYSSQHATTTTTTTTTMLRLLLPFVSALLLCPTGCLGQVQAGVYDFGLGRQGEKRGNWTPGEWLASVLLIMTIFLGLAVSIGLCYYVSKRKARQTFAWQQQQRIRQQQQRRNLGNFVLVHEANNNKQQQQQQQQQQQYSLGGGGDSLIAQI